MCGVMRTHLDNLQEDINHAVNNGIKVDIEIGEYYYVTNRHATPSIEIKTYIELTDEVENG
jgi:hypothetical protein